MSALWIQVQKKTTSAEPPVGGAQRDYLPLPTLRRDIQGQRCSTGSRAKSSRRSEVSLSSKRLKLCQHSCSGPGGTCKEPFFPHGVLSQLRLQSRQYDRSEHSHRSSSSWRKTVLWALFCFSIQLGGSTGTYGSQPPSTTNSNLMFKMWICLKHFKAFEKPRRKFPQNRWVQMQSMQLCLQLGVKFAIPLRQMSWCQGIWMWLLWLHLQMENWLQ